MEISFELNLEVNSLEQTGMQDGLGASGPPGLIYSSESAPVMGGGRAERPAASPRGFGPVAQPAPPVAVTVIEVGEQRQTGRIVVVGA